MFVYDCIRIYIQGKLENEPGFYYKNLYDTFVILLKKPLCYLFDITLKLQGTKRSCVSLEAERISFEQVYNDNFSYVYNYVYMRVLHRETAEDLTSQTFLNALSHYDSYDPSKAGIRTWLCTIARNLTTNHMTSSHVKLSAELDEEKQQSFLAYEDEYDIFKNDANKEVARLLSKLDDDERNLISMRFGLELDVKDIAAALDITENAARKRIKKVLVKCASFEEGHDLSEFI